MNIRNHTTKHVADRWAERITPKFTPGIAMFVYDQITTGKSELQVHFKPRDYPNRDMHKVVFAGVTAYVIWERYAEKMISVYDTSMWNGTNCTFTKGD